MKGCFKTETATILVGESIVFMVLLVQGLRTAFSFTYDSGMIVTPIVRIGESCLAL
ncbi:hypothetical protein SRABI134_04627 [Peribacillus sp. Bi134]|nr:hypothetical protein SRABI134_04627 [Peribacillus sp. Bi134]